MTVFVPPLPQVSLRLTDMFPGFWQITWNVTSRGAWPPSTSTVDATAVSAAQVAPLPA